MKKLNLLFLLFAIIAITSCDRKATEPELQLTNAPPQITQFTAETTFVDPGLGVILTCRAEDPDGDKLEYFWSCTNGTGDILNESINDSTTQATALFKAGLLSGLSIITIKVSDCALASYDSLTLVIKLPPPQELTAEVVSNSQVRLWWNYASGAADGFIVERSSGPEEPFTVIHDIPGDSMECLDDNLTSFQTYYYRVAAYNENGSSEYSTVVSVYLALMPTSGLVAWYKLNGDAFDGSGQGRNGQVLGATPIADRFGRSGQALFFNGVGAYVDLPSDLLQSSEITVAVWINWIDNTLANQPILHAVGSDGAYLSLTPKASPHFQITLSDGTYAESVKALPPLSTNQWTFIAFTQQNGSLTLYKNGAPIKTDPITLTPNQVTGQNTYLGGSPASAIYLTGALDDVRIYSRSLDAEEITQLYREGGWGY